MRAFEVPAGRRKTRKWVILSISQRSTLGVIGFFPRWHQYVFFPSPGTSFNAECLVALCRFLSRESDAWRDNQKAHGRKT